MWKRCAGIWIGGRVERSLYSTDLSPSLEDLVGADQQGLRNGELERSRRLLI